MIFISFELLVVAIYMRFTSKSSNYLVAILLSSSKNKANSSFEPYFLGEVAQKCYALCYESSTKLRISQVGKAQVSGS